MVAPSSSAATTLGRSNGANGAIAFSRSSFTRSTYGSGVFVFAHVSSSSPRSGRRSNRMSRAFVCCCLRSFRNASISARYAAGLSIARQSSHSQRLTLPNSVSRSGMSCFAGGFTTVMGVRLKLGE